MINKKTSLLGDINNLTDFTKKVMLKIILEMYSYLGDEKYSKIFYKKLTGKKLNLLEPTTFDEKLWWLKLNNRDPLLTKCSDKYSVREYVESCDLKFILNELYGVYDNALDIDFNKFSHEVFIKCNHGSGTNLIYDPEKEFDYNYFIKLFNFQLKQNYYLRSREWNYKNIKPKIICEKVLRDKEGLLPKDYKFLCFNGEPKLMFYDLGICDESGKHAIGGRRNVYDMNFNLLDLKITRENFDSSLAKKPENFEEMKKYAAILSAPFPHVRVDFYNVDGKVYFGEMTFYHMGACNNIIPFEWDMKLGNWIEFSNPKVILDETSLVNSKK